MNNIMDLFPVAVKQISPIVNILDAIEKGPSVGPSSFNSVMGRSYSILSIVQVGAGGTGGYVAAEIMKILGGLPGKIKEHIYYTIVDGDAFEEKNLGRQLCTEDDIGVNKAVSLVDNFAEVYGNIPNHIRAYPHYLESMDDLEAIKACIVKPRYDLNIGADAGYSDGDEKYKHVAGKYYKDIMDGNTTLTQSDINTITKCAVEIGKCSEYCSVYLSDYTDKSDSFKSITGALLNTFPAESVGFIQMSEIDINCKLYTIIIDCVDKTKPRKVIHEWLENQYSLPTSLEASILSEGNRYGWMDDPITIGRYSEEDTRIECFFSTYKEKRQNDLVRVKRLVRKDKNEDFKGVREACKNLSGVADTYIISSGNGKYTGQVYWGRYSRVVPNAKPVTYNDFAVTGNNMSTILSSETYKAVRDRLKETDRKVLFSDRIWTSTESTDTFIWNLTERAYEADAKYICYDENGSDIVTVGKEELVGARSYLNLPYEWNERKGSYVIDTMHPTVANRDAYMSAFMSVPSPYNRHPDLIDLSKDEKEDQMSCAERAAENVQNIAANKTAANIVVNYFRQILNGMFPLEKDSVRLMETAGVQFDVRTNSFKPELITKSYLTTYDSVKIKDDCGRTTFVDDQELGVLK